MGIEMDVHLYRC